MARTANSLNADAAVRDGDGRRDAASVLIPFWARPRTAAALSAAAVLGLAGVLFFFHLGRYGLWEPDEARYAEISREMLASGNYIVPHLNYVPYIEKPPMLYWTGALAMQIFGVNQFAARFFNALSALIGIAVTFYFTLRAFDYRRALLASVILTTTVLYALMAQVLTTDMLLTASITAALFAAWLHWREGGRWRWLFYAAMGFGILVKGPIAAALPITILLLFCWWEGDLRSAIVRFKPVSGLLLTIAIAAPWFIAISISQPDFIRFYFIGEYVRRFFQSSYSHSQPFYYYVPLLPAAMLPWTLTAPLLPWRRLAPNPARRFCIIAAVTTFVVFSIASAKLLPYILPALPPLAVIIADGLAGAIEITSSNDSQNRRLTLAGIGLVIAGIAILMVAALAPHLRSPNPMLVRPALRAASAVLIIGGIVSAAGFWRRRPIFGLSTFGAAAAALIIVLSYGRLMAEPARSYAMLARTIARRAPDAVLVCYPRYIQSLPFYTGHRAILVGAETELTYGAPHSPNAAQYFYDNPKDVWRLWNANPSIVLVIDRSVFASIKPMLGPFQIVAEDGKKIALAHAAMPLLTASPSSSLASSATHD